MEELYERLAKAELTLLKTRGKYPEDSDDYFRLTGKIQGVRLAMGYVEDEMRRSQNDDVDQRVNWAHNQGNHGGS